MHIIISQGIVFFSDSCNHYMGYVYWCLSGTVYCFFISFSILFHFRIFIWPSNLGQEWVSFSHCSASQTSVIHSCEGHESVLVTTPSYRLTKLVPCLWVMHGQGRAVATRQLQPAPAQHLQPGCAYWDQRCIMDTSWLAGGPWGKCISWLD